VRQHLQKLGLLPKKADARADDAIKAEPTAGEGEEGINPQNAAFEASGGQTATGSPSIATPETDPLVYDKELVAAIRKFQRMAGLKPDGIIGKGTIGALNRRNSVNRKKARMAKLKLNSLVTGKLYIEFTFS
jgi:murein L,D-transpeptidase YcbB/YkuD